MRIHNPDTFFFAPFATCPGCGTTKVGTFTCPMCGARVLAPRGKSHYIELDKPNYVIDREGRAFLWPDLRTPVRPPEGGYR